MKKTILSGILENQGHMKISKILLLTFFLLAELQLNNTARAADRVLKNTITDTIKNDSAPLGHWEINIEYPILNGTTPAIAKINTAIANAASEFQCEENNGDKQFTAEITVLNSNILSLKYTDSWYCAGMPQTEGRVGAMTFNLATGAMIVFDNEVRSSETKKLNKNINAGLEKALIKKEVSDECPTPTI